MAPLRLLLLVALSVGLWQCTGTGTAPASPAPDADTAEGPGSDRPSGSQAPPSPTETRERREGTGESAAEREPTEIPARVLAWNWRPGQVARYRIREEQSVRSKSSAMDIESAENITTTFRFEVGQVAGDSAEVKVTFEEVQLEVKESLSHSHVQYDSKTGTGNKKHPITKAWSTLPGRSFQCRIDSLGRVDRVRISPDVAEDFLNGLGITGMFQGEQYRTLWRAEGIAGNLSRLLAAVPVAEVRLGDRWPIETTRISASVPPMHSGGEIVWARTQVRGGGEVATFTLHTEVEIGPAPKSGVSALLSGPNAKTARSLEEGALDFSMDGGHLLRRHSLIEIDIELPQKNPRTGAPMDVLQEVRIRTQVDRL